MKGLPRVIGIREERALGKLPSHILWPALAILCFIPRHSSLNGIPSRGKLLSYSLPKSAAHMLAQRHTAYIRSSPFFGTAPL